MSYADADNFQSTISMLSYKQAHVLQCSRICTTGLYSRSCRLESTDSHWKLQFIRTHSATLWLYWS